VLSICDPAKIFLTSKFSYLLLMTPPIKLITGWLPIGGKLLIAHHLHQSLWSTNQKQGAAVRSYLLHSSLAGEQLCCAFLPASANMQEKNHFLNPNQQILTFLHPIVMCRVQCWAPMGMTLERLQRCSVLWLQTLKFIEKKSKCAFAQEICFSAPNWCSLPWPVEGAIQLCTSKKECNKLDLTATQCFWLVDHNDWSRWFAISSPHIYAVPVTILLVGLPKEKQLNLDI